MGRFGVTVTKSTTYRGGTQKFSNTYYYEGPIAATANTTLEALLDALVVLEKDVHATTVSFVHGRVWSTGLGQANNEMIVEKSLTGTGARSELSSMDKERAFLLQIPAGNDSKGRQVYLRKWYHTLGSPIASAQIPNTALQQILPLPTAMIDRMTTLGNAINLVSTQSTTFELVAQSGRETTGDPKGYRWLEHHQLGDEWRGV